MDEPGSKIVDQDLLLVLSQEGARALVAAAFDSFTELAHFRALEGKTWNHPVLVGDVLLVRNGHDMPASGCPSRAPDRHLAPTPGRALDWLRLCQSEAHLDNRNQGRLAAAEAGESVTPGSSCAAYAGKMGEPALPGTKNGPTWLHLFMACVRSAPRSAWPS